MADLPAIEKVHLVNLATADDVELPNNPHGFEERLDVHHDRPQALGATGVPLEYVGTGNHVIPLSLYFRSRDAVSHRRLAALRRFILSLAYPVEDDGVTSSTPPLLLVWPNVVELEGHISGLLRLQHVLHNARLETTYLRVNMTFEAQDPNRLTSEFVHRVGTIRSTRGR